MPNRRKKIFILIFPIIFLGIINHRDIIPYGNLKSIRPVTSTEAIVLYSMNWFGKSNHYVGLLDRGKKRLLWKRRVPEYGLSNIGFYCDREIIIVRNHTVKSEEVIQGLIAYNSKTGKELWRSEFDPKHKLGLYIQHPSFTSFSDRETVYEHINEVQKDENHYQLIAVDKESGKIKWVYRYKSVNGIRSYIQEDNHIVLLDSNKFIIVDKKYGKEIFVQEEGFYHPGGIVDKNSFWYISRGKDLYNYDFEKMENILIKKDVVKNSIYPISYGIYSDNLLVLEGRSDQKLYGLSKDGELKWDVTFLKGHRPLNYGYIPDKPLYNKNLKYLPIAFKRSSDGKNFLYTIKMDNKTYDIKELNHSYFSDLFHIVYRDDHYQILYRSFNGKIGSIYNGGVKVAQIPAFQKDNRNNFINFTPNNGLIWIYDESTSFNPTKNWAVLDKKTLELVDFGRNKYRDGYKLLSF